MGKIKTLLILATECRMEETNCHFDDAYEWAENQDIAFLLQYVNNPNNLTIDDVITWYKSSEDLNEYEKKALELLTEYKDIITPYSDMVKKEDKNEI